MRFQKGFTVTELIIALFVLLGVGGWIANIVKLAMMNFEPITTLLILRVAGIFVPPVGAVLGFF